MRLCLIDSQDHAELAPALDGLTALAPDRVVITAAAAPPLAAALERFGLTAGERYLDEVAAYVLGGEVGPSPERRAGWDILPRVICLGTSADEAVFATDEQVVELVADRLVIALASAARIENPANADLWIVPGEGGLAVRQLDGRPVLTPGRFEDDGITVLDCSAAAVRVGQWTELGGLAWRDDASIDWSHKTKMQVQG